MDGLKHLRVDLRALLAGCQRKASKLQNNPLELEERRGKSELSLRNLAARIFVAFPSQGLILLRIWIILESCLGESGKPGGFENVLLHTR